MDEHPHDAYMDPHVSCRDNACKCALCWLINLTIIASHNSPTKFWPLKIPPSVSPLILPALPSWKSRSTVPGFGRWTISSLHHPLTFSWFQLIMVAPWPLILLAGLLEGWIWIYLGRRRAGMSQLDLDWLDKRVGRASCWTSWRRWKKVGFCPDLWSLGLWWEAFGDVSVLVTILGISHTHICHPFPTLWTISTFEDIFPTFFHICGYSTQMGNSSTFVQFFRVWEILAWKLNLEDSGL